MVANKQRQTPVKDGFAVLSENRKARHNYEILDEVECGIVLTGTEVKSIRHAAVTLQGGFGAVLGGELWLVGVNIPQYEFGNRFNHKSVRNRKLLVHKKEVRQLKMKSEAKGLTLIPLRLHLRRGRIKVQLGICRGKALYDKRETLKRKAQKRDMERGE